MFGLLFIPLLTLHLLLVNVAMAGPFVCLWLEWRGTRREDILAGRIGERLAKDSYWALVLGILVGALMVGALWLRNDAAYFSGLRVVPVARLWAALGELIFSVALLAIYGLGWNWFRSRRGWHRAIGFLAATNLVYHFPPFFSALSMIARQPDLWKQTLSREEFKSLLVDPAVIAQSVHIWLSAVAVTGTLLMYYALKLRKKKAAADELGPQPARVAGWGAWLALVPSVLQLLVGVWVLLQMPEAVRNGLMGDRLAATFIFGLGILAALRLMHVLASIALGDRTPRQLVSAIATMALTVLLMSATLHIGSNREELNERVIPESSAKQLTTRSES